MNNHKSEQTVNVSKFLSVTVTLAEQCGLIIKEVYKSGQLCQKDKGVDDPCTIADLRVQKTIESCMEQHFPSLKLMGEESSTSLEEVKSSFKSGDISTDLIRQDLLY